MEKKMPALIVPSMRVRFKNKEVHNMVKGIIERNIYPSIFYMLMHKLEKEPDILNIKESSTDTKMTKTIHGLESIAEMIKAMNHDQEYFKSQMAESVQIMQRLTDELLKVKNQNKQQQENLKEVLTILSESNEGLEILKELKDKPNFNFVEVATAKEEDDLAVVAQYNQKIEEISSNTLAFGFGTSGETIEGFEDGEDLFESEFSDEAMAGIMRRFKAE